MTKVTNSIYYIGVNDHKIDLFEGQYVVENGMAYNSYLVDDKDITIFDTVDIHFFDEWMNNIKEILKDRKPKYLIVQHMEPDHSANIMNFLKVYPETVVVGNAQTFKMMNQFFHQLPKNKLEVKDGQTLNIGNHNFTFVFAPMVHWPEVMVTYESNEKILFSADGFGKFGALDHQEEWDCEARRYYFGIVGKYGQQVQALLSKAKTLDIKTICPLHGPILKDNLQHYLGLYDKWSKYEPEVDGIAIFYTSVYGHTKTAVEKLVSILQKQTKLPIKVIDLARYDKHEAIEDAFKYSKIVLATTTYNMSIFPYMNDFLTHLIERNYQKRTIGIIENGTWAPAAAKYIKDKLAICKDLQFIEPVVTILSSMDDNNIKQLEMLSNNIIK